MTTSSTPIEPFTGEQKRLFHEWLGMPRDDWGQPKLSKIPKAEIVKVAKAFNIPTQVDVKHTATKAHKHTATKAQLAERIDQHMEAITPAMDEQVEREKAEWLRDHNESKAEAWGQDLPNRISNLTKQLVKWAQGLTKSLDSNADPLNQLKWSNDEVAWAASISVYQRLDTWWKVYRPSAASAVDAATLIREKLREEMVRRAMHGEESPCALSNLMERERLKAWARADDHMSWFLGS